MTVCLKHDYHGPASCAACDGEDAAEKAFGLAPSATRRIMDSLRWCVENDGQCLGDYPAKLVEAEAALSAANSCDHSQQTLVTSEPDGYAVLIDDKGAPKGYWFAYAYTAQDVAEKSAGITKGRVVPIFFAPSQSGEPASLTNPQTGYGQANGANTPSSTEEITDGKSDSLCEQVGRHFAGLEKTFIEANRPEWAKLCRAGIFDLDKLRNYAHALERGVCVLTARSATRAIDMDALIAAAKDVDREAEGTFLFYRDSSRLGHFLAEILRRADRTADQRDISGGAEK